MTKNEAAIAELRAVLQETLRRHEEEKLEGIGDSPLVELIPKFLKAPVQVGRFISLCSANDGATALVAFELAFLTDPDYTAVDCYWMFTDYWEAMHPFCEDEIYSGDHAAMMLRVRLPSQFVDDQIGSIQRVFDSTTDRYLKQRAAQFLVYHVEEVSDEVTQMYEDGESERLKALGIKFETCCDSDFEQHNNAIRSTYQIPGSFDDFGTEDWNNYMGGPDDD